MFDKYSKRNTKSMSNKRNCLKHLFLISLIALIFASCSPTSNGISETATVRIETNQKGLSVASVMPTEPTLVKYEVELLQNDDTKYNQFFNPSDSIILEDVKIGTYKLVVTGYSEYTDEENNIPVVQGIKESITIYPDSGDSNRNHFDITLSYLSQGKGAISVKITWDKLTATGNLIDDAIKRGSLGFIALKASDNMPLKGNLTTELTKGNIQWADDVKSGSMVYEEDGLDANKTGEEIYFRIYSEIDGELVVIAETFSTVLQVYPNLTSVPDTNDKYNFSLSNDNIIGYLRNVTNAKAEAASDTSLKITWTNPKFSDSIYPITVTVTAKGNQSGTEKEAEPITYNSAAEAENVGETTIEELSSNEVYTIYFQIKGKVGYSANTAMISDARPRIPVSKISFDTTNMDSFRFIEGTMNKEIKAVIEPEDATVQTFSVTEKNDNENVVINGHNVTFNKAGAYTLVITSDDASKASAEQEVIIYLPTPSKPEIISKSENGIKLSWDEVTNASGYKITRESNKGESEVFESPTNSFDDITVATGNNYTYKVKATLNDDSRFDSDYSESSVAVNIDTADIEIKIEDIPSKDFSSIFDEYDGTIINSENPELTINLTQSIEGATKYKWVLDTKTEIAKGDFNNAHSIKIDSTTPGIMDTYESSHQLTLFVTINNTIYSGTLNFFYSDSSAATNVEITGIHTEDNNTRIIYGTPETFVADFKYNISGAVKWSSSNEDILYIDPTSGIAEAKTKGFVTITATLIADESKKYTLEDVESYIPATGISFSSNEKILILKKNGIKINDSNYVNFICSPKISTPNDSINIEDLSSKPLFTLKNNNGVVSIDENNIVRPLAGGKETIIASIDGYETNIDVYVWDIDILDGSKKITGENHTIGTYRNVTISLKFNDGYFNIDSFNASDTYSCYWCFEGNESLTYYDKKTLGQSGYIKIKENNNFSAIFYRPALITPEPTATALIKCKGDLIATISFKATH